MYHCNMIMNWCHDSVAYVGPSVTTYQCNNPAYRIYEIEGHYANSSYQMVDHHTYFTNLTEANANNNLTWQYEYSAKVSNVIM